MKYSVAILTFLLFSMSVLTSQTKAQAATSVSKKCGKCQRTVSSSSKVGLFFSQTGLIATVQETKFSTVRIEGFGSIGLPSNMEIQGGVYKEFSDRIKEINGVNASKVIFQQKNLNDLDGRSMETYARAFIRTETGTAGDFKKLSDPLRQVEADEVNATFKREIESEAPRANAKVLEWHKAAISTLNGQNAIKYGYKRQTGSNKPVLVEVFMLQNNDRLHIVTFEYRLDDNNWATTFTSIKATVKIIAK